MAIKRFISIFPFITAHYSYSQVNIIHRTPVFHGMSYERHCPGGFIVMVHNPTLIECDPSNFKFIHKRQFQKSRRMYPENWLVLSFSLYCPCPQHFWRKQGSGRQQTDLAETLQNKRQCSGHSCSREVWEQSLNRPPGGKGSQATDCNRVSQQRSPPPHHRCAGWGGWGIVPASTPAVLTAAVAMLQSCVTLSLSEDI